MFNNYVKTNFLGHQLYGKKMKRFFEIRFWNRKVDILIIYLMIYAWWMERWDRTGDSYNQVKILLECIIIAHLNIGTLYGEMMFINKSIRYLRKVID